MLSSLSLQKEMHILSLTRSRRSVRLMVMKLIDEFSRVMFVNLLNLLSGMMVWDR
jgi:hypothetical protein